MRKLLVCVAAVAGLLALGATAVSCRSAESRAGRAEGRAAAERAIADGQPALLFIGLPMPESDGVEAATGLPCWSAGCVIDDRRAAYVEAYNERTRAALAAGELKGLTLAHKLTTWAAVDERFRTEAPGALPLGGPATAAPGGRYEVEYRPYQDLPNAARFLHVRDAASGRETRMVTADGDAVPALFADEGTTLVVRDARFSRYLVLDLPRGIVVQYLPDPGRGW